MRKVTLGGQPDPAELTIILDKAKTRIKPSKGVVVISYTRVESVIELHNADTPEQYVTRTEEENCRPDTIEALLDLVSNCTEDIRIIVKEGITTSAKGLGFYLGLLTATGTRPRDGIIKVVEASQTTLPELWIVSLFDYYLGLKGQLTNVVEELEITGEIVTANGRLITCSY